MEKTLEICGKQVRFKATAGLAYRYFNQFGTEYISDLAKLQEFYETATLREIEFDDDGVSRKVQTYSGDFDKFSDRFRYNVVWVLAKTADNSIPDPLTWYDSFDFFDITEVYNQLQDIISGNNKTVSKN